MQEKIYTEKRPWGKFTRFVHGKKCTVKIIEVKPRQALSLQYHKHRSELWFALDSGLKVQLGKKSKPKKFAVGSVVHVGKKVPHRLVGGSKLARVLEISTGDVRENDIVRIEDRYGRA
ncbi:MAG: phosphomannose isomerase type II C-terminal cupin domain [Candidatus Diapherotrites archaeon]